MRINPYPGPRTFEAEESQYFFGRAEETEVLSGLVMSRRVVLLFAGSGVGKSSLVRAGLIPTLTQERTAGRRARPLPPKMRVLPIATVGGGIPSEVSQPIDNIYVFIALLSLLPETPPNDLAALSLSDGLAQFLKNEGQAGKAEEPASAAEPSANPAAIQPSELPTLLIFDQFEELFTRHLTRWEEREGFFRQVSQALSDYPTLHILFVMREDYIAELTPYTNLVPGRMESRYRLERLDNEAALQAVKQPAEDAGRPFASDVAEALVDNLRRIQVGTRGQGQGPAKPAGEAQPPILGAYVEPVHLQIVCHQLWNSLADDKQRIEAEDVKEFGDVDQALIDFYEATLERVLGEGGPPDAPPGDEKEGFPSAGTGLSERALRRWFNEKLITPARTKGLVYRGDHETEGLPNAAVDVLNEAYIIRADKRGGDTWYELAHDRLVEPILRANQAWEARYQNPVARAAETWRRSGKDSRRLFKGDQLKQAQRQLATRPQEFTALEKEFIQESQREEDRQKVRRQRWLLTGAIVLLVVVTGLALWAFWLRGVAEERRVEAIANSEEAEEARQEAEAAQADAEAARQEAVEERDQTEAFRLAFSALLNLERDPDLSVLLAVEAISKTISTGSDVIMEAEDALRQTLGESGRRTLIAPQPVMTATRALPAIPKNLALVFSPDSRYLAVAADNGTVTIWDTASEQPVLTLAGHTGAIHHLVFDQTEPRLATADADGIVKVWDVNTGQELNSFEWTPAAGAAGSRQADDQTGDTAGEEPADRPGLTANSFDIAFSADGLRLAEVTLRGEIRLWDLSADTFISLVDQDSNEKSANPEQTQAGPQTVTDNAARRALIFNQDGSWLATADPDSTVKIWEVAAGAVLHRLTGHNLPITRMAFSQDGAQLVTADQEGMIKVWEVTSGRERITLLSDSGGPDYGSQYSPIAGLAFFPDGARLATAGLNQGIRLWNRDTSGQSVVVSKEAGLETNLAFSPDGAWLAAGDADQVRLYTLDMKRLLVAACDRTGRNLSQEEWDYYIRDNPPYRKTCAGLPAHKSVILASVRRGDTGIEGARALAPDEVVGQALFEVAQEYAEEDRLRQAVSALDRAVDLDARLEQDPLMLAEVYNEICTAGKETQLSVARPACEQAANLAASDRLEDDVEVGILNFKICQHGLVEGLTGVVLPACDRAERVADSFISDGFDFPVGPRGRDVDVFKTYKVDTTLADPAYQKNFGVWHTGEDWNGRGGGDTDLGDPVYAVSRGRVVEFGYYVPSWGNIVLLEHFLPDGSRVWSHYSALDQIMVTQVGQIVERGQQIGTIGKGEKTDEYPQGRWIAHLGFEIRRNDLSITNWAPMVRDREAVLANYYSPTPFINARRELDTTNLNFDPIVRKTRELVEAGRDLALAGKVTAAVAQFREALELDPSLSLDPEMEAQRLANQTTVQELIKTGSGLAEEGKIEEAVAKFEEALALDPTLDLDPAAEAQQILDRVAAGEMVQIGRRLAQSGAVNGAITVFEQALALDPSLTLDPQTEAQQIFDRVTAADLLEQGEYLAKTGAVAEAAALFQEAVALTPSLNLDPRQRAEQLAAEGALAQGERLAKAGDVEGAMPHFVTAIELDPANSLESSYAEAYDALCWRGSVLGYTDSIIMITCGRAVALDQAEGRYRDSRGVARTLRGDYQGAIEDFQFFVGWSQANDLYEPYGAQRESWIEKLALSENPFDQATLAQLQATGPAPAGPAFATTVQQSTPPPTVAPPISAPSPDVEPTTPPLTPLAPDVSQTPPVQADYAFVLQSSFTSLPVQFVASPNFNQRGDPNDIGAIVMHATANSTAKGALDWFRNPNAANSVHYLIDKDGTVYQLVKEGDRAWHAGRSAWKGRQGLNDWSIGIQLINLNNGQDPYPEAQHEAAVQLAAYLVTKYNIEIEDIVAHADVALPAGRKTDPRGYDMDRLRQDVAALLEKQTRAASGQKATSPPTSTPYPRLVYVQTSTENTWDHATAIISGEDGEVLEHLVVDAAAPAWSPDGDQIAYFREKGVPELLDLYGEPGAGIYVVDARGENPRRLRQVENVRSLTWSPDGSRLAVEVAPPGSEDDEHEVLIIDAGDGRTVASFQGQYPTWGPDGEKLVIRDYNGLWQVNLQGEREDQLTQEGSDQLPDWSPDGQHLAFGSQGRDGDWEIYVLRFSDRSVSRLTERPGTDTAPVFSPDGQEIYFLAQYSPVDWTIEAIRLDGQSGPRMVKEGVGGSDLRGLVRPAVQP